MSMSSDVDSLSDIEEIVACPGLYQEVDEPNKHINNKPALTITFNRITNRLPWIERLDIITRPAPGVKEMEFEDDPEKIDANDDFKRENYFYRIAQAATLVAIPKFHKLNIPTKRPEDYFAEMVKSDDHMTKVKKYLIESQQKVALSERAKQIRERRKFGKQVQQTVLQNRKEQKQKLTQAIKKLGKKSGIDRSEQLENILNQFNLDNNSKKQTKNNKLYNTPKDLANKRKINHKRDFKNKKYGHGGQKKRQKRNTSESFSCGSKKEFDRKTHQAKPTKYKKIRANDAKQKKRSMKTKR